MNIFSRWRMSKAAERLAEEKIYEAVHDEIQQGILRPGLWTKALTKSGGNQAKAKTIYIDLRVQSMKDELEIVSAASQAPAESKSDRPSFKEDSTSSQGLREEKVAAGHKGVCEKCGAKTSINYGNAYHTYCRNCV